MSTAQWGQLANAIASFTAGYIWFLSIQLGVELRNRVLFWTSIMLVGVCSWYGVVNTIVLLQIWSLNTFDFVPFFRFAFPFAILLPPLRYMAYRKLSAQEWEEADL